MTDSQRGRWNVVALGAIVLPALSFLLGGAGRAAELRLALLELAAVPVLLAAAHRLILDRASAPDRGALMLVAAVVLIPLLQLIPMPFAVWSALPGRADTARTLVDAGLGEVWAPLSSAPDRTFASLLALLPPLAVFFAAGAAGRTAQVAIAWLVGAFALATVALGGLQLLGGRAFYLFEVSHFGVVTGFFANRNHTAAFLLCSLPLAGALLARVRVGDPRLRYALAGAFCFAVLIAVAATRSRMGVALAPFALAAAVWLAWRAAPRGLRAAPLLGLAGLAAAGVAAVALFAASPLIDRFERTEDDGRFKAWPTVVEAAQAHLPLGAGVGTFDPVFRAYEPLEHVSPSYFNQAHNDFLEIWLETGWIGPVLIVAFLVWAGRRVRRAWSAPPGHGGEMVLAGAAVVVLLMAHSVTDYPLRTPALAVLFAYACALIASPVAPGPRAQKVRTRVRREG